MAPPATGTRPWAVGSAGKHRALDAFVGLQRGHDVSAEDLGSAGGSAWGVDSE